MPVITLKFVGDAKGVATAVSGELKEVRAEINAMDGSVSSYAKAWRTAQGVAKVAAAAIAASSVAAAAAIVYQTKQAIDQADRMDELAGRTGIATEKLSEYAYAAKLTGTDLETVNTGLLRFTKSVAESVNPLSKPAQLFKALGVETVDADGKMRSIDSTLSDVMDRFKALPEGPEKAAAALQLFGRGGQEMIDFLSIGSDGLARFGQEAREAGQIVGGETAAQAALLNDNLDRLKMTISGVGLSVATELLPQVSELSQQINSPEFREGFQTIVQGSITGASAVAGLVVELANLVKFGGEEAARNMHGPDMSNLDSLKREYLEINAEYQKLRQAQDDDLFGFTGNERKMEDMVQQMSKLQDRIKDLTITEAKLEDQRQREDGLAKNNKGVEASLRLVDELSAGYDNGSESLMAYFRTTQEATTAQREKEKADREAALAIREQVKAIEAQAVAMGTLDAIIESYGAGSAPMREALEANRREFAELDKAIAELNEQGPVTEDIQLKIAAAYDAVSAAAAGRVAQAKKEEDVIGVLNAGYAEDIRLAGLSTEARQVEMSVAQAMALARRTHSEEWAAQHADEIRRTVESGEAQLLLAEQSAAAAEEFRAVWERGVDSVSMAIGDFVAGGMKDFDSLADAVKSTFRGMLADLVSQIARSGLQRMIAGLFSGASGGGGGGGMNWLSMIGSMFGGGGGAAGGGGGGFNVSSLTSLFGSGDGFMSTVSNWLGLGAGALAGTAATTGAALATSAYAIPAATYLGAGSAATYGVAATATGVGSSAAAGSTGLAGAASSMGWVPIVGWIIAAMAANDSMFAQGWRYKGGDVNALGEVMGLGGAVGASDSILRSLGMNERMASLFSGSAVHTRLWGRKAPRLTASDTAYNFAADGISGEVTGTMLREGGIFRSDKWEAVHAQLDDEALEPLIEFFDMIEATIEGAATRLKGEAPDMLDASLRVVEEFDKKGKVTATKYFVNMLGRTWEEATAEAAQSRIFSEQTIHAIDQIMGGFSEAVGDAVTQPIIDGIEGAGPGFRDRIGNWFEKALQSGPAGPPETYGWGDETPTLDLQPNRQVGEASAIAERWRDDAEMLAEGTQFLLLAATDIRAGVGLLKDEGGLTEITALVEDLQDSGETLSQTYARLAAGAGLFDQVLELSGISLDRSRESFIRWTAGVAEQAGGLDRLSALVNDYTTRYFTAAERAQYASSQAVTRGRTEFEDIGLNLEDFTGEGGMQALRTLFEQMMPTLSEEAMVQWLEALAALGLVIDASENLANTSGQTADQLAAVTDILGGNAWELAAAGMTSAERAVAEINRAYDEQRAQLEASAATVDQLNDLEVQRAEALEQQQAAMQLQIADLLNSNDFSLAAVGMTQAERAAADINRTYAEQRRQLIDLGATEAQLLQLELQRITALEQQTAAMQANIEALLGDLALDLNIDGLSESELAAARVNAQYDRYRQQLIDQGATVEQLAQLEVLRTEALEQANTALRENVLYARDAADSLSLFADAMKQIRDEFTGEGMRAMVERATGFSPAADTSVVRRDDVLAELGQNYAGQIADLSTQLSVAEQQLGSTPWFNFYDKALLEGKIQMLRDTLAQVGDGLEDALDYANELFAEQLGGLLDGLRREFGANDPTADINARFDTLREQAEAWGATNEELAEIEGYRQAALLNLIDDRYESEMNWIRQLMDFRDSLLLDDSLTTLTPADQMAEARRQYEATLAAAQSGDATAQAGFQSVAQAYLEQARAFFGSTADYTSIFDQVLANIDAFIANGNVDGGDGDAPVTAGADVEGEAAPARTITIDLAPVTASLTSINTSVQQQTQQVVAGLQRIEARAAAVEAATQSTAAEVRRLRTEAPTR